MSPKRLFVIDAMALAFRSYHAFGARGGLTTSQGIPVAAVYGSLSFLLKLMRDEKPDYIVAATDSRAKTFRHEMYPAYKANRSEMPEDLAQQIPMFKQLFEILRIPLLAEPGLEADDLIGSLVTKHAGPELHCYIVSGDKDFMQLVNEHICLYSPKKGEDAKIVNRDEVFAKFGCEPSQVIDILALIGDSSDNVPGVAGIGEKGAAQLIQKFGSLEGIYERLAEVTNLRQRNGLEQNREMALLSQQLVTIKRDAAIAFELDEMHCRLDEAWASPELRQMAETLEFKTILRQLDAAAMATMRAAEPPAIFTSELAPRQGASSTPELEKDPPASYVPGAHDYRLIDNPEQMDELFMRLHAAKAFAWDTETTGLDVIHDEPIGISFSLKENEAYYLPLSEKHLSKLGRAQVLEAVRALMTRTDIVKAGHNIKFDWQMMNNVGISVAGPFFDTMVAAHLVNANERQFGLDQCCLKYFNYAKIKTTTLLGKDGLGSMLEVPLVELATYACEDADFTWRLYECLNPLLVKEEVLDVFRDVEMPLIPVLAKMEQEGVYVDPQILGSLSSQLTQMERELTERIYELAGEPFNINSTKQLQTVLFEKLKIQELVAGAKIKKTKSGFSTDVSVLEQLAEHPLPAAILEYRSVTKLKSTYVDALPQLIHEKTARVHTSFHQTGTTTGRLSSSEPNLQNIPIRSAMGREIRKAFRPAKPDHVLISADYSQVELRVLAHLAQDENLLAAFQEGQDIHTATAAKIFAVAAHEVTPDQRSQAKAINFGIIYGMGPQRLARETGVKMAEAKEFIAKYFATYPRIQSYIRESIAFAEQNAYTKTLTGRRRPLPEIHSKDRMILKNAQNIAINTPVQGSAADLIKLAMVATQKNIEDAGLNAKLLLQVHDELLIECPQAEAETVKSLVKQTMESALSMRVPLLAEVGVGTNWLEAH